MIDKKLIKEVGESISEEIAKKIYYNLLFLRYIPEIKEIEKGKIKAISGKEINRFFKSFV